MSLRDRRGICQQIAFNGFIDYGGGNRSSRPPLRTEFSMKPIVNWFEIVSENCVVDR
jgi:hypothetical protein